MYKLYEFARSGNCYKLRLAMAQLGIDFQRIPVDILKGQSRTAEFLRMNPAGRVPVLETPDGRFLTESNAALWYLAADTPLLPSSRYDQAQALRWMFFEQNKHEPAVATLRYWLVMLKVGDEYQNQMAEMRKEGYAALDVMEQHLAENRFFAADHYSIADIALYAYTHVAPEGQFELESYRAIRDWLRRVEQTEQYVPMAQ